MSNVLEKCVDSFCYWVEQPMERIAAAAKKSKKKKLDPKAKVRNRGNVCVPAEKAKDKKDHFPINSEDQARNALARVHQYSSVPPWYKGSLEGLQALVSRKVHSKYPGIGKEEKKKSKKSSLNKEINSLIMKYSDKEEHKSLDPKAEVRNRGKCVFPAESPKVKDHQDHYPINNEEEALAALRYAGKQSSAPWYAGTVEELRHAVEKAVHKSFPSIGKGEEHTKKSELELLIAKYS